MAETSLPIDLLYNNKWIWDPDEWFSVKFNKNGTGEVRLGFSIFLYSS